MCIEFGNPDTFRFRNMKWVIELTYASDAWYNDTTIILNSL
jgi:hypothetical protein